MAEQTIQPLNGVIEWIASQSKWRQWVIFVTLVLVAIFAMEKVKGHFSDSPRAKSIKKHITPIAEQLDQSSKVGRLINAGELNDQISRVVNEYNNMSEENRAAINNSSLKYCLIAVFNLSDGLDEIGKYKTWVSREKYQAAMNECK